MRADADSPAAVVLVRAPAAQAGRERAKAREALALAAVDSNSFVCRIRMASNHRMCRTSDRKMQRREKPRRSRARSAKHLLLTPSS